MPASYPVRPTVSIVLPHRERFDPASAGAVAMVVQRLAAGPSCYRPLVIGRQHAGASFPGIDFMPVRVADWLPLTPTQRYAASLARLFTNLPPGLIEVHNKPDVAMWLARLFPARPVSLHLHNDPCSMRGAQSSGARRRLLRRLASVVTVSDYVRGRLLEGVATTGGPAPLVVHNTLDPAQIGRGLPAGQREAVILFAGRVVPDKAPDVFIAACARALPLLPGWRAEMIGSDGFDPAQPDSRFIARLRPLAAAAGVVLHGHKPHAEVLAAMGRAAIVVVPSRWSEPFGMTALEAMAAGAALISSARGGLGEVIGDAAIRIDPDDVESVSDAVIRLARDAQLRTRLATAGLERATTDFITPQAVAALDRLRDEITTGASGRRQSVRQREATLLP